MQPAPYIDIHTHRPTGGDPHRIGTFLGGRDATLPAGIYTAGIHPWQVARIGDSEREAYREALLGALTPQCVAIGEIGLDYAVAATDKERATQMQWFRWQLAVAEQHCLPVIIHCVRAYNDLIPEVARCGVPAVIHGFTGSTELAVQLLGAGCYLSFGQRSVQSAKTAAALRQTPLDRLFFETDESELPVEEIYRAAAAITGTPDKELRKAVYGNYLHLFEALNTNTL